jgi:hypothetical protein
MYLCSLLQQRLMWRFALVVLLMLGYTFQMNITQKDSDTRDLEMACFENTKILEQIEPKKSIIPEPSLKGVQSDLLSVFDSSSTSALPFRRGSSPLNE